MEILIILLIPLGFGLFFLYKYFQSKEFKEPEKVLKEIDIYLADPSVPKRMSIQILEQAIDLNPGHAGLTNKLNEIKNNDINNNTASTHETFYLILFIAIGVMGIAQIIIWARGDTDLYGLTLGILFIIGSSVIFRQYLRERR